MKPTRSLAQHLTNHAVDAPEALALIAAEQSFTWSTLLDEAEKLADTIPTTPAIFSCQGSSLQLALHTYACSLKNQPFWPVDRPPKEATLGDNTPSSPPLPAPDTALIISTSGSEGLPKAVQLTNRNLDAAASAANQRLPLRSGDLWLDCLPLYHIGGLSILWRCAQAGATVLLHEGFDAYRIADDLSNKPVTHISLVPTMLARLLEIGVKTPPSLRHAIIGGAALSMALYERATAAGWPLNPSYGMSESSAQIATWVESDGPWHEGLVGTTLGENEISLNVDGRIQIRGPQIMAGYLGENTRNPDNWFITGDLGKIDQNLRLTVTGRADDMLISGGRNVHPSEVESCLAACPGIQDVAVTALPDAVWGDLIVALVVANSSQQNIEEFANRHLYAAARPRRIIHLASLPRNPSGKLERSTLRSLASEAAR
jgi:O-succinylbenzoic acid--CoA ligase